MHKSRYKATTLLILYLFNNAQPHDGWYYVNDFAFPCLRNFVISDGISSASRELLISTESKMYCDYYD